MLGLFFESTLTVVQFFNHGSLGGIFYFFGERTFNSQTPGIANATIAGSLILRPYATFSHPNVLAAYLLISITMLLFSKSSKVKASLIVLGTIALFLTLSRAAIVAFIAVSPFYLFERLKLKKVFVFLALAFLAILVLSPIRLRFENLNLTDESVATRISLSKVAIDMFLRKPILGAGLNDFFENANSSQPVHNIFLLSLSETGIVGFLFFLWFIIKTYKKNISRKNLLALTLLSEILFLGFFDHYFLTLQQGQLLFALVLGLCWPRTLQSMI